MFVVRTCETISRNDKHLLQQPIIELKSCDDSDMLIYQYGNEYKVVYYVDFTTETITLSVVIWTMYILQGRFQDFKLGGGGGGGHLKNCAELRGARKLFWYFV